MIKFIIFDFDGVIEDSYELHYSLSKKKIVDLTREEHRRLFEGNVNVERDRLNARETEFDFLTEFSNAKKDMVIKDSIKDVLVRLSEKYTLGIITSSCEYGVEDYLANNNITELFSFVYGYETNKIKVKKFEKVLDRFDLKAEECVFVTDTLGDILEARSVGIKTVAVDFGYHEKERLQKGNPAKIISDISDLIPAIKSI